MQTDIKLEAQNYIKNNCKYYKQYFCTRNLDDVMIHVLKILENKLLPANAFCYYINHSFEYMIDNNSIYFNLSKQKRKNLEFYQTSIIKIYMHIDSIFNEIDHIKKYIERMKRNNNTKRVEKFSK